jgi:hypothetical protein
VDPVPPGEAVLSIAFYHPLKHRKIQAHPRVAVVGSCLVAPFVFLSCVFAGYFVLGFLLSLDS